MGIITYKEWQWYKIIFKTFLICPCLRLILFALHLHVKVLRIFLLCVSVHAFLLSQTSPISCKICSPFYSNQYERHILDVGRCVDMTWKFISDTLTWWYQHITWNCLLNKRMWAYRHLSRLLLPTTIIRFWEITIKDDLLCSLPVLCTQVSSLLKIV